MFDDYLRDRSHRTGEPFVPFDPARDYDEYVDGKPRADGVRSFLASRGIELSEGSYDDPPGAETVHGLGNRKNVILLRRIREDGVQVYESSVRYVRAARDAGLRRAVVSSSANTQEVLAAAGIEDLFEARIDGVVAKREHLRGKPAPDTFLAGARALGLEPGAAAVFEDALAGVEAGRAGSFRFVVGVDRVGQADALRKHGADVVVADLAELLDHS
jgi:HAD superfamily hydrolase (TIGR01509 family)